LTANVFSYPDCSYVNLIDTKEAHRTCCDLWQENLKTLRARDTFRAKTAKAAEKKWKEEVASERGDLAVARELRQNMFEQQRQYVLDFSLYDST